MVTLAHLDTDFLVFAIAAAGAERSRLRELTREGAEVRVSAVAWYEFCRGPRTPEQIAVAMDVLSDGGVVPFDATLAERAADVFRALGSPRKRAQDVAIAVTAIAAGATLFTRNARDFRGIEGLVLDAKAS